MTSWLFWLLVLGPLGLVVVAGGSGVTRRGGPAASAVLGLTVVGALAIARLGPVRTGTLGWHGVGFGVYLDALSAIVAVLVAFVGLVVVRYSRNYLDGDPGQDRFTRWLCLTLAAVLTLIVSGNMFQLWLAWIATSLSLNKLLLFYPTRPAAVLAARKKFVASRLADACVLGAMLLVYRSVGSLDDTAVFQAAPDVVHGAVRGAAPLLVVAALLKSAQFPLHGWLTEVMETPTPVSALLHAGVINAGGFLVLRFAGLVAQSAPSLDLLVVAGGSTALFGSAVMLTQTSVKVALAYSTIAQMGFMMLECGLGAFSAALLHLVAHSLYKAHAFLSSGSVIDLARASWSPSPGGKPHPGRMALVAGAVLVVAVATGALFGASLASQPGAVALGAVLLLGLSHLVAQGLDERPSAYVMGRVAALAAVVAVAYFGLQWAAARLTQEALPAAMPLRGPFDLVLVGLVVLGFAAVTVLQGQLPGRSGGGRWMAIYVPLSHGLYVNTVANRLALRLWPAARKETRAGGARS